MNIVSGKMRASLAPDLGGAVTSLAFDGRDVLRPAPSREAVAADPREAACYPCVPWFGRLFGGLDFAGRHYDLNPTLPICDPIHALHGHGWISPWTVTGHTADRLTCRFDYAPRSRGFPFPFSAAQIFSLTDKSFSVRLSVANTGAETMPAGLGLHPFFPNKQSAALTFNKFAGPIPATNIDDTFSGWDGVAKIESDAGSIELERNANNLHLYSPAGAGFFCAEPVSHRPGEFGGDLLAPGEEMTLFLLITVRE